MSNITVWTKQHENVLKELETAGRYIAKQEYIRMDLKEQAPVVLEAYDWLVKHGPDRANKPADVEYPVWVSFTNEGTMMNSENTVILELSLDPAIITSVNIAKWGHILNYGYIPKDENDLRRHRQLLERSIFSVCIPLAAEDTASCLSIPDFYLFSNCSLLSL